MKRIILAVSLLLVVCLVVYISIPDENDAVAQGVSLDMPLMEVSVISLKSETAVLYEELPGRTVAYKVAEIRPQVSGIITERLFNEGSSVTEGDQLYQIDPSLYEATFNSAMADLKKAQANVKSIKAKSNRFKDLVEIDAISKQEYDDIKASLAQAEADVAIAEASVAGAKINLEYTKVYAPISGRIGKSAVTKGALVTASQSDPLATITLLDPMYVDMTQSSADLMQLRHKIENTENIPVTLILGDNENNVYEHEGTLQFHEVTVDQTTGSVQLRALFPNQDNILLPGLFVRARLKLEYPGSLLIAQEFTQRSPDGKLTAWVMDKDNIINSVILDAKKAVDGKWIVISGLKEDDVIVTEGFIKLQPGMKIKPIFAPVQQNDGNVSKEQ